MIEVDGHGDLPKQKSFIVLRRGADLTRSQVISFPSRKLARDLIEGFAWIKSELRGDILQLSIAFKDCSRWPFAPII
jgi:hypothetical protein